MGFFEVMRRMDDAVLTPPPPREDPSPWERSVHVFAGDLVRAWAVWRKEPWLPVVALAFASVFALSNWVVGDPGSGSLPGVGAGLVALLLGVTYAGWLGTERLVYLMAWRGEDVLPEHVGRAVKGNAGRYTSCATTGLRISATRSSRRCCSWRCHRTCPGRLSKRC